jgi:hypothetical protein
MQRIDGAYYSLGWNMNGRLLKMRRSCNSSGVFDCELEKNRLLGVARADLISGKK